MARVELKVVGYKCERCGHQWIPRSEEQPRICPKCKSAYWDRPRRKAAEPSSKKTAAQRRGT